MKGLRKKLVLILMILNISFGYTQEKYTISGYIEDAKSGEKLIGANIYDEESMTGTTSNIYGFYSLTLPEGSYSIIVSFVGFQPIKMKVDLTKDVQLNMPMGASMNLKEVEISATKSEKIHENTQMSTIKIPMKQIEVLPTFMGERDIIKMVQLLPGVQSGSEGTSGLYVRGGGPDQNLILLDGVPVYNANHLFGFFSVFNPDAVKSVELVKGGFPARYGGRLSSVLDIRMKEGNMKEFKGSGSIGLVSSKLALEGPIWKDKTSFIISGRRTYIDVLSKPFIGLANQGDEKIDGGYFFYDLNAKINHKFSDKNRLYLSAYTGDDKAYSKYEDTYGLGGQERKDIADSKLKWGNITTALRWNSIINKKLFMNTTLTYSKYQFVIGNEQRSSVTTPTGVENEDFLYEYYSGINDVAGSIQFDYIPNPNHYIKIGLQEIYHAFEPGVTTSQFSNTESQFNIDTSFGSSNIYAHEMGFFVEDDIKIGARLKTNIGIHLSAFNVKGSTYFNPQPRIAMNYLLTEDLSLKASYSRMAQYIHLLTNTTIGLPTDLWVPVTDTIPPMTADQIAIGIAKTINDEYELSIEGYYKQMNNLIEYKDGASFFTQSTDWQEKVEIGQGDSYGAEILLQKKFGKLSGWIGYTLSWTNRQFENVNFGQTFPYKFDRRHDIGLALTYQVNRSDKVIKSKSTGDLKTFKRSMDLGLVWVYGTGNAVTLPVSTYLAANTTGPFGSQLTNYFSTSEVEYIQSRNGYRMPDYHRLDLSVNFNMIRDKYEETLSVGVYNVYSRQNPFYLFFGYNDQDERVLKQISLFPIIPFISYKFKF
ncbi:MAG: TonB-dependent receptor [Flavobacteriales bacterium]|nr:TonB-dependent receptor [Flavobacteriales bacterium]